MSEPNIVERIEREAAAFLHLTPQVKDFETALWLTLQETPEAERREYLRELRGAYSSMLAEAEERTFVALARDFDWPVTETDS